MAKDQHRQSGVLRDQAESAYALTPKSPARRRAAWAVGAGLIGLVLASGFARAEEAVIAVATNFAQAAEDLRARFEAQSGHDLKLVYGSTGKLYAQIVRGAPFDGFLAADQARPALLGEGAFTYATGRLVLWSPSGVEGEVSTILASARRIAIANPELAPYGQAAEDALRSLGLWDAVEDKLIFGENVGQAFAMAATGNAEVAIVALSLVQGRGDGAYLDLDGHAPIHQDAILLSSDNPAAVAFFEYLRGAQAQARVTEFGYEGE